MYKSLHFREWRPRAMCKMHVNMAPAGRVMTPEDYVVWVVMMT